MSELIWLLRHGDADEGTDDHARRLTERGRAESRAAGRALAALAVAPQACLSSPRVRAIETASIACGHLGLELEPEPVDALAGGDFDPLELAAGRGEVLIVGHEPDLSRAINVVTGARVEMKKGSLAAIEDGALRALLRHVEVAAIAGRG